MTGKQAIAYTVSILLWILSAGAVALVLRVDYEGYVMAAQTIMIAAIVVAVWAMTALLSGKG